MDSKQQHQGDSSTPEGLGEPSTNDVNALLAALAAADPSDAPVTADRIAELLGRELSAPEIPAPDAEPSP